MRRILLLLLTVFLATAPNGVRASLTPITGSLVSDLSDYVAGAGGTDFTRIDDEFDRLWEVDFSAWQPPGVPVGTVTATLIGHDAGWDQELNLYGPVYQNLINTEAYNVGDSTSAVIYYTGPFAFMDRVTNSGVLVDELFSIPGENPDAPAGVDHMVSSKYTDKYDLTRYIIAWEDEPDYPGFDSDWDYNDFVVELYGVKPSPVPVPATLFLFGSGIAGLIGINRRKRKLS